METQGTLDFSRTPFQPHSRTSLQSAVQAAHGAKSQRARVLEYLKTRGILGATDEEIQIALGMNPSTERPRRIELVRSGDVVDAQVDRKTKSGRYAVAWRAVKL